MAVICQKYKAEYYFVTMYDTRLRIPIFSAYNLDPYSTGERKDNWKIEPQLAAPEPEMVSEHSRIYDLLADSQAFSSDYVNAPTFDRGHLAPVCHQSDQESMNATFTLTNTVPMDAKLNRGQWKAYEQNIKQTTSSCLSTYAIVGVVPGNTLLNNRVNIPSHIWAAICCEFRNRSKTSWAFIAENNNQNKVISFTLTELERFLSFKYGHSINLFNGACK
ncbi:endonuclease domain-containing 1 protein-like [Protobothrops mucrosquamatus]|uniref:endonuclease domain-containing 1 protein-like n=1 Tax=Protobothrops mucrosquamatus TaxID=103944 RepID=UPI000775881F|nr:endonuclease domain-containing 1 protein-like [Protobothrops mucrosquamatus]